jgi:rare lipoprotein A
VNAKNLKTGTASWYSEASCKREGTSGVWTSSGERFYDDGLTCAMRSREFGKYYEVCNMDNNKCVIVRHNDFGPNKKLSEQGRVVDLSKGAFSHIADLSKGLITVSVAEVK